MASGVPRSGAMDPLAVLSLNAMLGNEASAAAVEWALTGGDIELDTPVAFAFGGTEAEVTRNGEPIEPYRVHRAAAGEVLSVRSIGRGRFLYLAFAGGIDTTPVMGSRSTCLPCGFGGLEGRRLKSGDSLPVGIPRTRRRHHVTDPLPPELRPPLGNRVIRFVIRDAIDGLAGVEWSISAESDRTGYRLAGGHLSGGASIVSEPVGPGVIQVPAGGEPIVLMQDAPTVGGYRIAGAVISVDLRVLAQRNPGEEVSFEPVTVQLAQRELAAAAETIERIREWSLA
jgi:antagonist of KipI